MEIERKINEIERKWDIERIFSPYIHSIRVWEWGCSVCVCLYVGAINQAAGFSGLCETRWKMRAPRRLWRTNGGGGRDNNFNQSEGGMASAAGVVAWGLPVTHPPPHKWKIDVRFMVHARWRGLLLLYIVLKYCTLYSTYVWLYRVYIFVYCTILYTVHYAHDLLFIYFCP